MAIGHNAGAVYVSEMTSAGLTTTGVDSSLEASDDYINGHWVQFTSGTNDGSTRIINNYVGSTTTWTIRGDAVTATADGDTYELWEPDFAPARIHNFINRAIRAAPRKAAPPVTNYSMHTGGSLRSFNVPTAVVGIQAVSYRSWHKSVLIHACDAAFDESVTASVTVTADDEDLRRGASSNRFNVAAAVGTGLLASDNITSLDLSGYTHLEFWIKSTVATVANDLVLRLSATANAASATDDINVPALVANTWTYVRVALANPHLDTAIISVGLRQAVDIGAAYIWLDEIRAVRDDTEIWQEFNRTHWRIDRDERELVLAEVALGEAPYALLKIEGVQKPTELNADATSADIEPEYIIAKATALALRASGDRTEAQRQAAHQEADRWEALAQKALGNVQMPHGVVWVDD